MDERLTTALDGRLTTALKIAETEQQGVGDGSSTKEPTVSCFDNICCVVDVNEQSQLNLTGDSDRQTMSGDNAVVGHYDQEKDSDIEHLATKTPVSLLEQGLDNPALEKDSDIGDNNTTKETPVSLLEKGLDNPALDKDSDLEHLTTEEDAHTSVDHPQALPSPTLVTAIVECGYTREDVDWDSNQNPIFSTVERSGSAPPYTETVVTAVVEYVDEDDDDDVLPISESSSRPNSVLGMTEEERSNVVAMNTAWLASGDVLPSLPPPVVVPIDEPNGLTKDGFDKATTDFVLEMKILQKSEPGTVSPPGAERCDSQMSTLSDKTDICRICHCEGEENNKLISPCLCSGSLKYLHLACLQKWIKSSDKKACELCNFDYIMSSKTRPFKEWEKLEMTHNERRKVVCSVTFHIIAITCVIWSLYVLIDRTTEEVHLGTLDWPFWTKLIVVTIGFTGGMIFMYVQCKMYVHLCARWRSFNKLITIENAPEDPQLRAEAAARIKDKAGEERGVVNTVALQEMDSL